MISPNLKKQIFALYKDTFVSLHTDDPGDSGANEVSVTRQPARINDDGVNSRDILFTGLPQINGRGYGYIGIWSAAKGGTFIQGMELVDSETGKPTRRVSNKGDVLRLRAGSVQLDIEQEE